MILDGWTGNVYGDGGRRRRRAGHGRHGALSPNALACGQRAGALWHNYWSYLRWHDPRRAESREGLGPYWSSDGHAGPGQGRLRAGFVVGLYVRLCRGPHVTPLAEDFGFGHGHGHGRRRHEGGHRADYCLGAGVGPGRHHPGHWHGFFHRRRADVGRPARLGLTRVDVYIILRHLLRDRFQFRHDGYFISADRSVGLGARRRRPAAADALLRLRVGRFVVRQRLLAHRGHDDPDAAGDARAADRPRPDRRTLRRFGGRALSPLGGPAGGPQALGAAAGRRADHWGAVARPATDREAVLSCPESA